MLADQVKDFWEWFYNNQQLIEEVVDNQEHLKTEAVVQSLNQHILGMGKIKWELGNPSPGFFTFTLSPNSDRELLKITKTVIASVKLIPGWSFYHALQPTGNASLQMYDLNMEIQEVNAHSWRVAPFSDGNGRYELMLEADNIMHLDEDTQTVAVDLILNALLGEERKIKALVGFDILDSFDDKQAEHAFPMLGLSDFLGE